MQWILFSRKSYLSRFSISIFIVVVLGACALAQSVTDEDMQPIAARVGNVAAAVRSFAVREPDLATRLSEGELYLEATSHDPQLRDTFKDFCVKARPSGVVLICTPDGKRGLVEDAACTTSVDALLWREERPCEFCIDLSTACPRTD